MADTPPEVIPDFRTEPVTDEDFNLIIKGGNNSELRFGYSKKSTDAQFGKSSGKSIFDNDMYPLFNAHFNQSGELDGWKIYLYEDDSIQPDVSRLTKKGFVSGESTISDVISRYGSAGVRGNGIIDYYYKKMNDGTYQDISIYDRISNMEDVCMIAFLVDDKTQVVYDIIVKSSLKDAF